MILGDFPEPVAVANLEPVVLERASKVDDFTPGSDLIIGCIIRAAEYDKSDGYEKKR
jgi:hypothetical protein